MSLISNSLMNGGMIQRQCQEDKRFLPNFWPDRGLYALKKSSLAWDLHTLDQHDDQLISTHANRDQYTHHLQILSKGLFLTKEGHNKPFLQLLGNSHLRIRAVSQLAWVRKNCERQHCYTPAVGVCVCVAYTQAWKIAKRLKYNV